MTATSNAIKLGLANYKYQITKTAPLIKVYQANKESVNDSLK